MYYYNVSSDPLIVFANESEEDEDEVLKATGEIIIPEGSTITIDEYDPKTNIHTTMFNFWDELHCETQHCLYEIDYNSNEITSFIKDRNFEWMDIATEELSEYADFT